MTNDNDPTTAERVDWANLKELHAKATAGEWAFEGGDRPVAVTIRTTTRAVCHGSILVGEVDPEWQNNVHLIAALHNSFDAILAERAALIAERDAAIEQEQARWQKRIDDEIVYPVCPNRDGAGCESGDPLDVTISELHQAMNAVSEQCDTATEALKRICGVWRYSEQTMDNIQAIARTALEGGKRDR